MLRHSCKFRCLFVNGKQNLVMACSPWATCFCPFNASSTQIRPGGLFHMMQEGSIVMGSHACRPSSSLHAMRPHKPRDGSTEVSDCPPITEYDPPQISSETPPPLPPSDGRQEESKESRGSFFIGLAALCGVALLWGSYSPALKLIFTAASG